MGMIIEQDLHSLFPGLKRTLSAHKVELAYLFGSVAAGDARPESDVDLAVLLPARTSSSNRFRTRLSLQSELTRRYKKQFDVVLLNDTQSLLFLFVIISQGKRMYCSDESALLSFEGKILAQYADFKPFLDQYEAHYIAKNL